MKVDVYWNLTRNAFSVRARDGEHRGKVIARLSRLVLEGATFHVSPAGHARVIRERRKNVHAVVRGQWERVHDSSPFEAPSMDVVTYSPYVANVFLAHRGRRRCGVASATKVLLYTRSVRDAGVNVDSFTPEQREQWDSGGWWPNHEAPGIVATEISWTTKFKMM